MAEMRKIALSQSTQEDTTDYDTEGLEAIKGYHSRLNELLSSIPDVNFEEKFGPYLKQMQERQTKKRPGTLEAFARGFGSKEGARSVMEQVAGAEEDEINKERESLATTREILAMKLEQEMGKGQAQKALQTDMAAKELDFKLGQLDKKQQHERKKKELEFEYEQKTKLEEEKGRQRVAGIREKALNAAIAKGLDPNKVLTTIVEPAMIALKARLSRNPVTGRAPEPEEREEAYTEAYIEIFNMIEKMKPTRTNPTGTFPTGEEPQLKKSRARLRADELMNKARPRDEE